MKHYCTYTLTNLNTSHNEYDDTVRICHQTMHYNTTLVDLICGAFLKAQLLYDEGIISDRPYKLRIIAPEDSHKKFKEDDANTAIDRIEWYIINSMPPPNGIVVDLFTSDKINPHVETPWAMNKLWSATRRWQRSDASNYVTINFPDGAISDWKSERTLEGLQRVEEIISSFGFDIEKVSYKTDIEEAAKLMLRSQCHFTYIGGTYSQAAFLGVPIVAIGKVYEKKKNMSADPKTGKMTEDLVELSMYGHAQICPTKIPKYDYTHGMVRNGPVSIVHIKDNINKLQIARQVI